MYSDDFQKKINQIKESDFLDGFFDSWQIWIKKHEFSIPYQYMNCGFDSEISACNEVDRIKAAYKKMDKQIFEIIVKKVKVKRLKKPISIT